MTRTSLEGRGNFRAVFYRPPGSSFCQQQPRHGWQMVYEPHGAWPEARIRVSRAYHQESRAGMVSTVISLSPEPWALTGHLCVMFCARLGVLPTPPPQLQSSPAPASCWSQSPRIPTLLICLPPPLCLTFHICKTGVSERIKSVSRPKD